MITLFNEIFCLFHKWIIDKVYMLYGYSEENSLFKDATQINSLLE